jgi:HEAT repeat protein
LTFRHVDGIPGLVSWLFAAVLGALIGTSTGERVEVRQGGSVVASFVPATPSARRGPVTVREITAEGRPLVEVRIARKGAPGQEVWLGERGPRGTTPLWTGLVGPQDGDGETGRELVAGPGGVELHQTAVRLSRCDGQPAHLFRERWDFAQRRFRPAPPALPPAGEALRARRGDPDMPATRPVSGFFWTGASSAAGARDARALTAPGALNDGDAATAWTAGGSDGRGEWVTARASGNAAAVVGLRITPASGRKAGRPRRLALLLGPAESQRFDVELADDHEREGTPYWVRLPKPVSSSCLTVVIREVAPGGPAALADLDVITELDGPGGVARLVETVRAGTDCESRVAVLAGLGEPALLPLTEAIRQGPGPGRECLLSALDRLVGGQATAAPVAEAVVAALDRAKPAEEKLVLGMLPRLAPPPVEALAAGLSEKRPDDERMRAVRALAVLEAVEPARAVLIGAVGSGSPAVRTTLRERLAEMKTPLSAALREALAAPNLSSARRADLLHVLGTAATREPEARAANLAVLRQASGGSDFEAAARAIAALGRLGGGPAVTELARIRAQSSDQVLRYLATRELASVQHEEALGAVREALGDVDPRVRETAALALGHRRDGGSAGRLVAAAKQEPWPFVRRAEVSALGAMCAAGDLLVRAHERDVSEVRREALIGLARCRDGRAPTLLLRTLGRREEDPDLRALSARLLGTLGDRTLAPPFAQALARLRVEAQADLALEGVAVVAVQSLARVGGPDAVGAAVNLLADERPVFRKAAVEALGQLCDRSQGARAVEAATRDNDPTVAAAAAGAQRRCRK